jgi:hypothetical protein
MNYKFISLIGDCLTNRAALICYKSNSVWINVMFHRKSSVERQSHNPVVDIGERAAWGYFCNTVSIDIIYFEQKVWVDW